jgi:hypothetical protein
MRRKLLTSIADRVVTTIQKLIRTIEQLNAALLREEQRNKHDAAADNNRHTAKKPNQGRSAATQGNPQRDHQGAEQAAKWTRLEGASHWAVIIGSVIGALTIFILVESIRSTTHANRIEQRAWVSPIGNQLVTLRARQMGRITTVFSNSGQTPALNVVTQVWHDVKGIGQQIAFNQPPLPKDASRSVLAPDSEITHDVIVYDTVTPNEIGVLQAGYGIIYILGRVTYDDVFGQSHWATFCLFVRPDLLRMGRCGQFWDTDDSNPENRYRPIWPLEWFGIK